MDLPTGRPLRRGTYYNLLDAWWDRIPGLHVVDFGVDLDLDGEVWTLSCWGIGEESDWVLNVAPRSVRTQLSTEPETVDASTLQPWASVIGAPIQRQEARGRCVLRLYFDDAEPIVVASGDYLDEGDLVMTFGPNVLVAVEPRFIAAIEDSQSPPDC